MDFYNAGDTELDNSSEWYDEDAIYEAECIKLKPEIHTQRVDLREDLPKHRDGAIRSNIEGSSSGQSIFYEEQSNCSVSIKRLVWVDGWRQGGAGEAMTLVVLKLGFKPQGSDARVSYASVGIRLKSDKKKDEDPKLVAWGPFRRPEKWNVTPAHKRSNVSPSFTVSGGGGGQQVSLGVNIQKEIIWDENFTDYGLSAERPNGVMWQVFENKILRRGITPEVRVAALFSRPPPTEKYRVELHLVANTGAISKAKHAVSRAVGRHGGDTVLWSVEARPGLKDNCYDEGENIIKEIDPDNLGAIVNPCNSTDLDPEWLNKWDRVETFPQALTEPSRTEVKPAAESSSSRQKAEQPMPQNAVRKEPQEHPYDLITGVSRLVSGEVSDVPLQVLSGAPGAGGLDVPTASLPNIQRDSRLVALEARAAQAEARIAEHDRLVFELQQALSRVAQALLAGTRLG